jgi:vacuolar protein sorting-associated protein 45
VTLSCEISNEIEKGLIFEVSRIEQDTICQDNRKDNIEAIWKILKNERIEYYLKLKLVLLFSVKYPNDKEIKEYLAALESINSDNSLVSLVSLIQQYQQGRKSDLFLTKNLKKKALSYFDRILKDVPNVYTQHRPHLFEHVLPEFLQDRVKETDYRTAFAGRQSYSRSRPLIIVFFVGGTTYTEAKEAEAYEDAKVVMGGTFIHNAKTFISEVIQLKNQGSAL